MKRRISGRSMWLAAAALAALLLISATAGAEVFKNTATGETLKGTLTNQSVLGLRLFVTATGSKIYLDPAEWKIIEEGKPGTTAQVTEKPAAAEAPRTTVAKPGDKPVVYIIPIVGEIKTAFLIKAVERSLAAAKLKKTNVVVFRMDTPGGRVDVGMKIIDLIGKVDWARTVAWVNGDVQKGAISCGAFISLSTEAIYMSPETSIGAAVPFMKGKTGSHEVDEKFQSVFAATFRNLAEKRGYPKAMANAMVTTAKEGIVQVFVDDHKKYVTVDEAARLEKEHAADGKFKRGETVCDSGKILCLTADEAVKFDLAKALVKNQDELLNQLGLTGATVVEAKIAGQPLTDWVTKSSDESSAYFKSAYSEVRKDLSQADALERVREGTQRGTPQWNDLTQRGMAYLKKAAETIKACEKRMADDFGQDAAKEYKSELADLKSDMEVQYNHFSEN